MADPAVRSFAEVFPHTGLTDRDLTFEDNVVSLEWSPDGTEFLVLCRDGSLSLVDVRQSGSIRGRQIPRSEGGYTWMARWSPDSRSIAVLAGNGDVYLLDARTLETRRRFRPDLDAEDHYVLAWLDDTTLVLPTERGMSLWDPQTDSSTLLDTFEARTFNSLAVSPSGDLLAAGDTLGTIAVWSSDNSRWVEITLKSVQRLNSITWLSSSTLASTSMDGIVIVWDLPTASRPGEVRTLEGHLDEVRASAYLEDRRLLATRSWDGTMRLWDAVGWDTAAVVALEDEDDGPEVLHTQLDNPIAVHPSRPLIAVATGGDRVVRLLDIDRLPVRATPAGRSVHYVSAKIVLLGESGVGKTALGWRLAHDEFKEHPSTHGQQFWGLDAVRTKRSDGTECEAVLWDLAGQPDYRLVHALFVNDADLALVLVNPTGQEEPLQGAEFWLRMLARAGIPSVLVGARSDRGEPALSRAEINRFCAEHGVSAYVATSALDSTGVPDLVERIRALVDWDRMPATTTTETFKRVQDLVVAVKEGDPVLADVEELRARLGGDVTADEVSTAVGHLAKHGYVQVLRRSSGGRTVLLKPELLNNLASSLVLEARRNPRGLGALEETRVVAGDHPFPELAGLRPADAEVLLDAATALFLRHAVCFRAQHAGRTFLVFPGLINQKRPVSPAAESTEYVSYIVTGAVENVYAALVVLLGYTGVFSRTDQWQNTAEYEVESGETLGFRQVVDGEGQITLVLHAAPATSRESRALFQALVEKFLSGRKVDVLRILAVRCAGCGYQQDRAEVVRRLRNGKDFLFCPECGARNGLPASAAPEEQTSPEVTSRQLTARLRTTVEAALVTVKALGRDRPEPTCFVSYAWGDKDDETWVETVLAQDLRKAGIDVVLDRWHNAEIGRDVARFVETVGQTDAVVAVGTPAYLEKHRNPVGTVVAAEMDLINQRLTGTEEQKRTVRPVLRHGEKDTALPPLMRGKVLADMRTDQSYLIGLFDLVVSLYGVPFEQPAVAELRRELRR